MTINKKDYIKIPNIVIAVLAPMIVAIITAFATTRFQDGKLSNQVDSNTKELEEKVDESAFEILIKDINDIKTDIRDINEYMREN